MQELKPYAESVVASQLEQGEVYFMLNYFDSDLLVPDLTTLIFLGRDVLGNHDSLLYFQDVDSYNRIGPFPNNAQGQPTVYHCSDDQLACIFLLEKVVDSLRRCVINRSRRPRGAYDFCNSPEEETGD